MMWVPSTLEKFLSVPNASLVAQTLVPAQSNSAGLAFARTSAVSPTPSSSKLKLDPITRTGLLLTGTAIGALHAPGIKLKDTVVVFTSACADTAAKAATHAPSMGARTSLAFIENPR